MVRFFIFFVLLLQFSCSTISKEYITISGQTQGTYYRITCEIQKNVGFQQSIDSLLLAFNNVYSNYNPQSLISRFNKADSCFTITKDFLYFWNTSLQMNAITNGAFDITIAPIVNAWRFGYKNNEKLPSQSQIDSMLNFTGMELISNNNESLCKKDTRVSIISNAIAQGYAVDVVSEYLDSKGVRNYLIDIGGEMKAKGVNANKQVWSIGVATPKNQLDSVSNEYSKVVILSNKALATSGNYRKYYIIQGKKYGHTIDPHTGNPIINDMLSATIVTDNCIEADAIATACMVMGFEKSRDFIKKNPKYDALFLYGSEDSIKVFSTSGILLKE